MQRITGKKSRKVRLKKGVLNRSSYTEDLEAEPKIIYEKDSTLVQDIVKSILRDDESLMLRKLTYFFIFILLYEKPSWIGS